MELSRETKQELLRDCTPEELKAAIEAKKLPSLETTIVVEDRGGCIQHVEVSGDGRRTAGCTDWLNIEFKDGWYWDVASIDSLIDGLKELRDKMTP